MCMNISLWTLMIKHNRTYLSFFRRFELSISSRIEINLDLYTLLYIYVVCMFMCGCNL